MCDQLPPISPPVELKNFADVPSENSTNISSPQNNITSKDNVSSIRFKVGVAEAQGRRPSMEDKTVVYASVSQIEDYFAVFDGHGGQSASKFCADHLHPIISSLLSEHKQQKNTNTNTNTNTDTNTNTTDTETDTNTGTNTDSTDYDISEADMTTLLKTAFTQCNESLKTLNTCNETGTTAVIAYRHGNHLWIANVGDSRAVLSKNGRTHRITTDHKPTLESERKRILDLKGFVFLGRVNGVLAVSRALGDFSFNPHVTCEPDVFGPFKVDDRENDFIILACDGLWDVVEDDKAVQIIAKSRSPKEGAEELVTAALRGRSVDNISVVVVYFPHYEPPKEEEEEEEDDDEEDDEEGQ